MTRQRTFVAAAAVISAGLLWAAAPAIAHHSSAPFYDPTKKVEVKGTVTRLLVKNPHSFLYLTALDEKGQKVDWQVEMGTGAQLARNNLTIETLKPGTDIVVSGQPSRAEGSHGMCCIISLTKADGTQILRGRVPQEPQ